VPRNRCYHCCGSLIGRNPRGTLCRCWLHLACRSLTCSLCIAVQTNAAEMRCRSQRDLIRRLFHSHGGHAEERLLTSCLCRMHEILQFIVTMALVSAGCWQQQRLQIKLHSACTKARTKIPQATYCCKHQGPCCLRSVLWSRIRMQRIRSQAPLRLPNCQRDTLGLAAPRVELY
jgi:hypothetical protein